MKKPAAAWKPVPVAVQVKRHHKAVVAARRAAHAGKAAKAKRSAAAKKAAATRAKHRKWTPDGDVALCSARAVAEAIRIASGTILSGEDVLGLYWSVASDGDSGISILDALTAAQPWGLACSERFERPWALRASPCTWANDYGEEMELSPTRENPLWPLRVQARQVPIILGLDLPGGQPHAVVAHDGAWWSWGQPYQPADFPGAVIEEAWTVTWQ